ncbi:RIC1-domain-containing protein [Stachybotrys elegans]|uniref:RIC1-domain-containing protein n=1 Tax=Stachybotrys elegans TaxID=80388 RepID=A0A8K0T5S3_9HYPO|nr:RIC1-domain-containing protein [Stachybotrys elegans]
MYWPIGTPRIYATSSSRAPAFKLFVSHDGLRSPRTDSSGNPSNPTSSNHLRSPAVPDISEIQSPITPITPLTPGILSVEHDDDEASQPSDEDDGPEMDQVPLSDPVLALRTSRSGQLFAVITATSITIWQTKPTVILALAVRSEASIRMYGANVDLLLRPDSAILVVRTSLGYLITYSIATDTDSRVYKPHFSSYHNVQRRRQSLIAGQNGLQPDQILWGPGEGNGVRDVSVRFRMVIKVDAGIESALALDDELIVATRKPAAVQCIRWTPDNSGSQTRTELLSRMGWMEKKASIVEMTHDRPMNLATWVTSDGRAYAVQRQPHRKPSDHADDAEAKRLFKGHCFHIPQDASDDALHAVINARFSLIAVGCRSSTVRVYSVKDYSGNIVLSHTHSVPVSSHSAGAFTTLSYSPDGYCLFAGFQKGWSTWSMLGKPGSSSFTSESTLSSTNGEMWLSGVSNASWIGGGSEILITSQEHEAIWGLEVAKSAVTGCYNEANVFRTVLQTPTSIMHPPPYLLNQWPIRQTVISPDGRYVAVAGRRGLAHYSVNSGRWKTFVNEDMENEFQVRGGMCWYQHVLVAAVEGNRSYELRLYSRESALDASQVLHTEYIPAPIVLITTSGEDSLLVYTYENLLYHYIFTSQNGNPRLTQVGQIAFHGIIRSPARVRGLSWILPESQLADGDPSQDVAVASVIFLVDGKLVLLRPSLNDEGQLKYDMRVIAQNVEYHASMRGQPLVNLTRADDAPLVRGPPALQDSLWIFDGMELKAWPNINEVLDAAPGDGSRELPTPVSVPVDFYPLSILLEKGIVLGVESDLVQRRDVNFSFFHFAIRTHLVLPDVLRFYLQQNKTVEASTISHQYQDLEYFSHGLEILLHRVLDEEVDTSPKPEDAVLPRVLSLLSSFKEYLDIVLQCTRKTEVRQWKTLFAYLPPASELFEESLQRGSLKTAGGYLIVLHTLQELEPTMEQSVRLLSRAMAEDDWDLCKELARFLAALDETGEVLQEVMKMVNVTLKREESRESVGGRLELPLRTYNGSRSPRRVSSGDEDGTGSDVRSASDTASIGSTLSAT